jgi:DNA-binding FrmR family transcriptional regulator
VILDVKQELGEIKGRVTGIETSMKENREDVKEILKSVSVIPELRRMLMEHLKEDEPTELYVDRSIASWAKKGMWAAATGLAGWFVAKVTGR